MNAGKSTHLLQVNHNYKTFGNETIVLSHSLDTRFGENVVASRLGIKINAHPLDSETNVLSLIDNLIKTEYFDKSVKCILVDESQFLTEKQVVDLSEVCDNYNIDVICYGLKTDAFGSLFEGSKALLEYADSFEELKQLCFCGRKATMVRMFDSDGNVVKESETNISIGSEEKYISLCRYHWKTITNVSDINP